MPSARNSFAVTLTAGFAAVCALPGAAAGSKAADWLVQQEIAAGCDGGSGRFDADAVIERDLTGDGNRDLIISHSGLQCGGQGRSLHCGIRACSVLLYVREGSLLKQSHEVLSVGVSVEDGSPPVIRTLSHDLQERALRWDGSAFQWE
jgi:hypothetical protein